MTREHLPLSLLSLAGCYGLAPNNRGFPREPTVMDVINSGRYLVYIVREALDCRSHKRIDRIA
jgi:hypothetical protein